MESRIESITSVIAPLKERLAQHDMYKRLSDEESIRVFMQHHVFAVWDFMSLTKWLQYNLVSKNLPWMPPANPRLARFINEIVLSEESDIDQHGEHKSHFEMYLMAMKEMNASTDEIEIFLGLLKKGKSVSAACEEMNIPKTVERFMAFTFSCIQSDKPHVVASAFTFGREDVIPKMFLGILENSKLDNASQLTYYMQRHIELDGDEHGPMAIEMLQILCGTDLQKWKEVELTAITALNLRISLWDGVEKALLAETITV
jgi:hypothetical protein